MPSYQHHLSCVFRHHADALAAWDILAYQGMPVRQMSIEPSLPTLPELVQRTRSQYAFNNMLLLGGVGATTGLLLASLAELALIAIHAPLLNTGLVITTLALLGSGVTLGLTLGAVCGAIMQSPQTNGRQSVKRLNGFYDWMHSGLRNQKMQLSVNTFSAVETAMVTRIMHDASVSLFRDYRIVHR
ncbi:hypothetical protein [Methylophilus sp. OH31]|uniref:hypothetical protein n=1 Tax=Methylophilus sp. OH31 TaxID=1387312 RepID=UPI000464DF00|nr:hypothetical protein [Methylophilus sp. OH31]